MSKFCIIVGKALVHGNAGISRRYDIVWLALLYFLRYLIVFMYSCFMCCSGIYVYFGYKCQICCLLIVLFSATLVIAYIMEKYAISYT